MNVSVPGHLRATSRRSWCTSADGFDSQCYPQLRPNTGALGDMYLYDTCSQNLDAKFGVIFQCVSGLYGVRCAALAGCWRRGGQHRPGDHGSAFERSARARINAPCCLQEPICSGLTHTGGPGDGRRVEETQTQNTPTFPTIACHQIPSLALWPACPDGSPCQLRQSAWTRAPTPQLFRFHGRTCAGTSPRGPMSGVSPAAKHDEVCVCLSV